MFEQVICPKCNRRFERLDKTINNCPSCRAIFFTTAATIFENGSIHQVRKLKAPEHLLVKHTDKGLVISWAWFNGDRLPFLVAALVYNLGLFLFINFGDKIRLSEIRLPWVLYFLTLIPMPIYGLIGLLLIYGSLAALLNTTTISVNKHKLTVFIKPIPMPFNRTTLYSDIIKALYLDCTIQHLETGEIRIINYIIMLNLENQAPKALYYSFTNLDHALFIMQEISSYLGYFDESFDKLEQSVSLQTQLS